MHRFLAVLFVIGLLSCEQQDHSADFSKYQYDQQVIDRLPAYDSLASVILQGHTAFIPSGRDSHYVFRYRPFTISKADYQKLPQNEIKRVDEYIGKVGRGYIYGFDLFRDSSIRFYVRDSFVHEARFWAQERLSYFNDTSKIPDREPPTKDTVLQIRWQYWIRFDEPELFDN